MKLLLLSYLVSYVLVERIRYEIHKVAGLPCQGIDRQALSFISSSQWCWWVHLRLAVNKNISAIKLCMCACFMLEMYFIKQDNYNIPVRYKLRLA